MRSSTLDRDCLPEVKTPALSLNFPSKLTNGYSNGLSTTEATSKSTPTTTKAQDTKATIWKV